MEATFLSAAVPVLRAAPSTFTSPTLTAENAYLLARGWVLRFQFTRESDMNEFGKPFELYFRTHEGVVAGSATCRGKRLKGVPE